MSKPFDATLKELGASYPSDFLATFDGQPTLPVTVLNVDLSTVTTAGDMVIGLGSPLQEIVHIDFQAAAKADKHRDVLVYNTLLHCHYAVPVHSIMLLLRPKASHPNTNGEVCYAPRPGRGKMEFGYEVVRLWEWPVERLLAAGPGVLPLAMLGKLPEGVEVEVGLTAVVQRIVARLDAEANPDQVNKLLTASFVLTGLRLKRDQVSRIFQGVKAMHESDTYLAIMDEGAEKALKKGIFEMGKRKFGAPDAATIARLEGERDLERLNRLLLQMLAANDWKDLLDTP